MSMNRKAFLLSTAALAALVGMLPASLRAQTWNQTASGTYPWENDGNWTGPFPNAQGAVANLTNDIAGTQTLTISGNGVTIGVLNIGDGGAAPDSLFTIGNLGAGKVTFDNGGSDAQINSTKEIPASDLNSDDLLNSNVQLNSNLVVTVPDPTGDYLRINGAITGNGGITKNGLGYLEIGQSGVGNSYTGRTVVNGGRLRMASGGGFTLIPGDIEIDGNATLQDSTGNGNAIADTANLICNKGFYNPGGGSEVLGGLEGTSPDSDFFQIGGGTGTITFGKNDLDKTYNGQLGNTTSYTKVGLGVETLGGTQSSFQNSGARNFTILAGRVDLNKPDNVTSIAQTNVNIGDGSQAGASRPELRLLHSEQIAVRTFTGTPAETNVMNFNNGVFNANGQSETIGSAVVNGSGNTSTIDTSLGGSVTFLNGMTINDGAIAEVKTGATGVLNTTGLTINGAGKLDVTNSRNVTVTGGNAANIRAAIITGRAEVAGSATWAGAGITSSAAAADPDHRAVGYADLGGAVKVALTVNGDANLDSTVNSGDFDLLAANFNSASGSWATGDFNYDGTVNALDFNALATNFGSSLPVAAPALGALVPEPASIALIALTGMGLMRRRKR